MPFQVSFNSCISHHSPYPTIDDEEVDDEVVKVNNISHTYKYNEVEFSQSDFATYLKAYMKKLKKKMKKMDGGKERVKVFKEQCGKFMEELVFAKFEEMQFFCTESYDMESTIVYSYYPDPEKPPVFIYLIDGLNEQSM